MNDAHLFSAAKEVSFKSDYSGGNHNHIGCVIAYKGTILANGFNSNKTHPIQSKYNYLRFKNDGNNYLPEKVHSEIHALSKIKYLDIDFSRVHIYVYRELKNGNLALARPCPSCMAAIKAMGIRHVHFSTADGFAHEVLK